MTNAADDFDALHYSMKYPRKARLLPSPRLPPRPRPP